MGIGFSWALDSSLEGYAVYGLKTHPGSLPAAAYANAFDDWLWVVSVGLMGTLLLQLFPDGRPLGPRWRPLAWDYGGCSGRDGPVQDVLAGRDVRQRAAGDGQSSRRLGAGRRALAHAERPRRPDPLHPLLGDRPPGAIPAFAPSLTASAQVAGLGRRRDAQRSTLSTLLIAVLFQPVRERIQSWVDQRFYRGRYDAQVAVATFSSRLRSEIDLESPHRRAAPSGRRDPATESEHAVAAAGRESAGRRRMTFRDTAAPARARRGRSRRSGARPRPRERARPPHRHRLRARRRRRPPSSRSSARSWAGRLSRYR